MSLLSEFLSNVDEGYVVIDNSGRLLYANDFAIKKGMVKRGCEGRPYYECFNVLSLISAVVESFGKKRREKYSFNYEGRDYEMDLFPSKEGLVIRIYDITRFKQYERSKKEFIANVSHELKTPIAIIKSILETLLEEEEEPNRKALLERALRRTEELNNIVNDLLIITKLESGEEKLNKRSVKLRDLVEAVFDSLMEISHSESVELINQVEEDFEVFADEEKLFLLLLNLVENAIKYNKSGGKVWVKAYKEGGKKVIEVSDTGIGIPKEHLPFIFERFYRANREKQGTGLGLAIVKHIALSHGGKVDVESKEGQGSTFRVILPDIT